MKIVLLPGLDGSGKLFEPILPFLDTDNTTVIPLPNSGAQDYETLKEYVKDKLPNEDYILVAESFSGPIGVLLAKEGLDNLKAIVFVATFLTPPNKFLLNFCKMLPINKLTKLPFSSLFLKIFILGYSTDKKDVLRFKKVIDSVPLQIIQKRLNTISTLSMLEVKVDLPSVYIRADSDKLVPSNKCDEFLRYFSKMMVKTVKGPHFILQANPSDCASIINSRLKF